MNQSRRRARFVVLAVVLLTAILLVRSRFNVSRPPTASPAEHSGRVLAAAAARRAPASTPSPTNATPAGSAAAASRPARANMAQATAAEYRQRARYPHHSVPIEAGQDPILRDRAVSPNVAPDPTGNQPSLVSFPDQVSFEDPDPIVLYAYLSVNGVPVPARSMSGAISDQKGETLIRVDFTDDGRDGDAQAGDAVYAARIQPAVLGRPVRGPYRVSIHALTADGEERFGSTGFLYSRPDAQLTGRYADALVDGNLEIRAEVDVRAPGRFHLEATLYSQSGAPLVWAQNALPLTPGQHWIPLSFFGLALRDKGEDGPYVLRFVALSTTTEMPNDKNRLVENAYATQAYSVTAFSDQPFNDANLLDAAARLERSAPPEGLTLEAEPQP